MWHVLMWRSCVDVDINDLFLHGLFLQVTQALGRSVVRTLGYVEQPGEALKIILEADDGSVLQLRQAGRLDCEFGVRPCIAQHTARSTAGAPSCVGARAHALHGSVLLPLESRGTNCGAHAARAAARGSPATR